MSKKRQNEVKQNKFLFDEKKKKTAGQVLTQLKESSMTKQKADLEWSKNELQNPFKKIQIKKRKENH